MLHIVPIVKYPITRLIQYRTISVILFIIICYRKEFCDLNIRCQVHYTGFQSIMLCKSIIVHLKEIVVTTKFYTIPKQLNKRMVFQCHHKLLIKDIFNHIAPFCFSQQRWRWWVIETTLSSKQKSTIFHIWFECKFFRTLRVSWRQSYRNKDVVIVIIKILNEWFMYCRWLSFHHNMRRFYLNQPFSFLLQHQIHSFLQIRQLLYFISCKVHII